MPVGWHYTGLHCTRRNSQDDPGNNMFIFIHFNLICAIKDLKNANNFGKVKSLLKVTKVKSNPTTGVWGILMTQLNTALLKDFFYQLVLDKQ